MQLPMGYQLPEAHAGLILVLVLQIGPGAKAVTPSADTPWRAALQYCQ
jgi:hypothetical protein